ncbi:MAG: ATP-binding protein [Coprococcus sp.]
MKIKVSFRSKVIGLFLICIICCMLIVAICCRFFLRPLFVNNSRRNMLNYANIVEQTMKNDADNLKSLLEEIETDYLIHTSVIMTDEMDETEIAEDGVSSRKNGVKRAKRWIERYNENTEKSEPYFCEVENSNTETGMLVHIRVSEDGSYIVMNKSIKGIEQDIDLITIFIIIIGISIAIVGTVSFWILLRPSINRLEQMTVITEKMSELDFGERIKCESSDEFGTLAYSVNKLSGELSQRIDELRDEIENRKTLIRNLSHEIKTPITTIRGYAENAQIVVKDNDKLTKYCNIIIDECDSVNDLVACMMDLSKLESDGYSCRLEEIETSEFVENMCRRYVQKLPDIKLKWSAEKTHIMANPYLLERAIGNYFENAVKYGGPDCRIEINFYTKDDRAVFVVGNDGPMIPVEEQDKIWNAFYKQDKARTRNRSYGVGLPFVEQIARLHQGGVEVASKEGWTEFVLWMPYQKM